MCLGVPMQVMTVSPYQAICAADGESLSVNTALIDNGLRQGDWLLVHQNRAIRILTPEDAATITRALRAVVAVARGEPFEEYFSDLIGREPQLPAHLIPPNHPEDAP